MEKPKPKNFGYDRKYGWPNKVKLQAYRKSMSEYQRFLMSQKGVSDGKA